MINENILEKYGLPTLKDYKNKDNTTYGEELYYRTFLAHTDHIPNKIIEQQILLGVAEDYTDILQAREFARNEINRLIAQYNY